ncbi:MAG TPA: PRC-barrel domain-containing protein [Acetobacteraceae bacterium]|nr:PRC-barrel domain-containing protein [Acetobacteraceae bacterium]
MQDGNAAGLDGVRFRPSPALRILIACGGLLGAAAFGATARADQPKQVQPPPAAKQPSQPAQKPAPPPKPAKLEHIRKAQAEGILGEAVLDAKGNQIGRIVDVLINAQGTPHAAVIEFAGFLGVGNRNIAVLWKALHFAVVKDRIVISLDMDPAKLKAMPTYKVDAPSVPVAAPAKAAAKAPHAPAAGPASGQ